MAHTDDASPSETRVPWPVIHVALVAAAYLVATVLASEAGTVADLRIAYWPAVGVLVGGLLTSPTRRWPAVLGAALVLRGVVDVALGLTVVPTALFGVGQAMVAAGAAWGIARGGAADLTSVRRVRDFGLVAFAASFVGAVVGSAGLLPVVDTPAVMLVAHWWAANALGIVTVAPVVLVVAGRLRPARERSVESVLAFGTAVSVVCVVFLLPPNEVVGSLTFATLLPLLWVATRTRAAGAVITVAVIAHVVLLATLRGAGPFAGPAWTASASSAMVAVFIAAVSLTTVLLAVRTDQVGALRQDVDGQQTLLAAVSHELRTPLTAIVGFSEALVARGAQVGATEHADMVRAVHRNAIHLSRLVDDLFTLRRMERDEVRVAPEDVEVAPFVHRLLEERRHDDVPVTVGEGPAVARVDPRHLAQVVHNLLDNAMRHGRDPIAVELAGHGAWVRLAVADHGDGVPADVEHQLFEAFTRSGDGRRQADGLGLGLLISRVLAVANGGDLAYQRTGDVTRFVFTMPAANPSPTTAPGESS